MHRVPKTKPESTEEPTTKGNLRPVKRHSEHVVEHVEEEELQKAIDRINEEDAGLLRRLAE